MDPIHDQSKLLTRRYFFGRAATGIGTAALASLLNDRLLAAPTSGSPIVSGILGRPHIPATAKRVIYLSMNGAPSQLETFDYKPKLNELFDARFARFRADGAADHDDDVGPKAAAHCSVRI